MRAPSHRAFYFIAVALAVLFKSSGTLADHAWVRVDNPGNRADKSGFGAVNYVFEIMRYEVTSGEYADFLNAVASQSDPYGLWDRAMGEHVITDLGQGGIRQDIPQCIQREFKEGRWYYSPVPEWANKPVIFVSFLNALRYANWMHNGAGHGDTEAGAYRLSDGVGAKRLPGARVWVPSEDEWYKAAYFQLEQDGGPPGCYWQYPMRTSDTPVTAEKGLEQPNAASFSRKFSGIMPVGSLVNATSPCGAYDMGGNVWEWTEGIVFESKRVLRGGAAAHNAEKLRSTVRSNAIPTKTYPDTGFRLARAVSD
jgi:formylglycine-generating enzyme